MDAMEGQNYLVAASPTAGHDFIDLQSRTGNKSMRNTSASDDLMDYWQYRWYLDIKKVGPPFVVIVGIIGNLLSLIVLLRPRMRIKSTFLYLAGVAAADLIFLLSNPLRHWIEDVGGFQFAGSYSWACKLVCFVGAATTHYSVWLLALVTLERFIVVANPLRGPLVCRRSRALAAMSLLLALVVIINLHHFWTFGPVKSGTDNVTSECRPLSNYQDFLAAWEWIDVCVYSLLPFFVILILNILIIVKAKGAGETRLALSSQAVRSQTEYDSRRLTFMLMILTFTFLLTTVPMSTFIITMSVAKHKKTALWFSEVHLAGILCRHIMWINHAVNFFLYCLVGKKFRQELYAIMHCRWRNGWNRAPRRSMTLTTNTSSLRKEHLPMQNQSVGLTLRPSTEK